MTQQSPTRSFLVGATFRGAAKGPRPGSTLARLALAGVFGGGLLAPFAWAQYPQSTPPANYGVPQSYATPQNYAAPQNTATQNTANISADPRFSGQSDEQLAAERACSCSKVARLQPSEFISSCSAEASFALGTHANAVAHVQSPAASRLCTVRLREAQRTRHDADLGLRHGPGLRDESTAGRAVPVAARSIPFRISALSTDTSIPGEHSSCARERELGTAGSKRAAHNHRPAGCQSAGNFQYTDSRQRKLLAAAPAIAGRRTDAKRRIPAEPAARSDGLGRRRAACDGSRSAASGVSDSRLQHRRRQSNAATITPNVEPNSNGWRAAITPLPAALVQTESAAKTANPATAATPLRSRLRSAQSH